MNQKLTEVNILENYIFAFNFQHGQSIKYRQIRLSNNS